jgi:WS/DGAT/MGAT family acyltransferase
MVELRDSHLGPADSFAVSMERDPLLRSTIVAVALLDSSPDLGVLTWRLDRATRLSPVFRQRLTTTTLGLAPPRFTRDPEFDLSVHLRRVAAPEPRTFESVLEFARLAGMTAFDPARPLWEFTLVEGLTEKRAALILKVHHALTDGIGGMQLLARLVDLQREPTDLGSMPELSEVISPGRLETWRDALASNVMHATRSVTSWIDAAPPRAVRFARDPVASIADVGVVLAAIARFVRPVTTTLSPVMRDRRLGRHYATMDVPLEPMRQAGKLVGGTVNDSFIAGLTGGLRRYHERFDAHVESLRLTMPISVREEGDPEGGNRITLVRFEVPVSIEDPLSRIREINARCSALRDDPALAWSDTAAKVLQLLPSSITGGMLKHVDFVASNIPGFAFPVFVGGAELIGFYPFGPTLGAALNVVLMSYRGTSHLGINMDEGAVSDPELLVRCLHEGFEEVLALVGEHDPVRRGVP